MGPSIPISRALHPRPPGEPLPPSPRGARSGYFINPDQSAWQDVCANTLEAAVHPPNGHASR